ncbi:MAG: SIMPL domain-containing protein [Halocynthiibacter sp.]
MKHLFTLIAVLFSVAVAHADDMQTRHISVTGDARVALVPDIARLQMGVIEQRDTAKEAFDALKLANNNMIAALKNAGLDAKDMQTHGLNLSPSYQHNKSTGQPNLVGYSASNTLAVTLRDLHKTGDILDAVLQNGANRFHGLSFDSSKRTDVQADLRKAAIQDAIAKATTYVEAAGGTLGPVISIRTNGHPVQPMYEDSMARMGSAPMEMAAGEVEIHQSIHVTFEIK